jgi:hypothetical protein
MLTANQLRLHLPTVLLFHLHMRCHKRLMPQVTLQCLLVKVQLLLQLLVEVAQVTQALAETSQQQAVQEDILQVRQF